MADEDRGYFLARAEAEREMAAQASHENIAEIHKELARMYDALAAQPALRTKLRLAF